MDNLSKIGIISVVGILLFLLILPVAQSLIWNVGEIGIFSVNGTNLYMEGLLNKNTLTQIKNLLEDNPQVDTLILVDVWGTIDGDETMEMGYWIREKGLSTHLKHDSNISSGGVDLFVAGVNRTMENGAQVGVHSWAYILTSEEGRDFSADDPIHESYVKYFQTMLGDDEFYWYTLNAAPSDDLYYMTNDEIKKFGLLTR